MLTASPFWDPLDAIHCRSPRNVFYCAVNAIAYVNSLLFSNRKKKSESWICSSKKKVEVGWRKKHELKIWEGENRRVGDGDWSGNEGWALENERLEWEGGRSMLKSRYQRGGTSSTLRRNAGILERGLSRPFSEAGILKLRSRRSIQGQPINNGL